MSYFNTTYWCSTDAGTKTAEYITLRENLSSIINSLRTVRSKEELRVKFIELDWLGPTAEPCERDLVLLVLNRVQQKSCIFYKFVTLLNRIGGMSLTATDLITKLNDRS